MDNRLRDRAAKDMSDSIGALEILDGLPDDLQNPNAPITTGEDTTPVASDETLTNPDFLNPDVARPDVTEGNLLPVVDDAGKTVVNHAITHTGDKIVNGRVAQRVTDLAVQAGRATGTIAGQALARTPLVAIGFDAYFGDQSSALPFGTDAFTYLGVGAFYADLSKRSSALIANYITPAAGKWTPRLLGGTASAALLTYEVTNSLAGGMINNAANYGYQTVPQAFAQTLFDLTHSGSEYNAARQAAYGHTNANSFATNVGNHFMSIVNHNRAALQYIGDIFSSDPKTD